MKKLVLKTVFATIGVVIILALSVFGIVSLCAPRAMMRFSASLGLEGISGDYAYEEYERSGDVECLARSFLISASRKSDKTAEERFEALVNDPHFEDYCKQVDENMASAEQPVPVSALSYRDYVMGQGACVKYRLAETDGEKSAAVGFAVSETGKAFNGGNPAAVLSVEIARAADKAVCAEMLSALQAGGFEESEVYSDIINILEEVIHE